MACIFRAVSDSAPEEPDLRQGPYHKHYYKILWQGFPGGAVVGNPPANAGDTGSSPGLGRSHMPRSN